MLSPVVEVLAREAIPCGGGTTILGTAAPSGTTDPSGRPGIIGSVSSGALA